ncbi:hypothetical protein SeLEV6574_g06571 [Synchytrium endobioticum]|uniref:Endonuclease/exonuclease/phosphatase domain-containing protein n=1 Tax=Synchytrium endobioticum TaxID=286115 RepID=A0A507CN28_9FUNG|nr:hypothetical protein SeLEV6574_g06571 [Synchytrium endobioticum]
MLELMEENNLDLLVVQETWLRPNDKPYCKEIISDIRAIPDPVTNRGKHGIAVIRNPKHQHHEFQLIRQDDQHHTNIWINFRDTLIGGYYLPPSLSYATTRNKLLEIQETFKRAITYQNIIVAGDFNIRLGGTTGDTGKSRAAEDFMSIIDAGAVLESPDNGKWTFQGSQGWSIVDHILTSTNMHNMRQKVQVHESQVYAPDDNLVTFVFLPQNCSSNSKTRKCWNLQLMKEPEIMSQYVKLSNDKCENTMHEIQKTLLPIMVNTQIERGQARDIIDKTNALINTFINDLSNRVIGKRSIKASNTRRIQDSILTHLKRQINSDYKKLRKAKDQGLQVVMAIHYAHLQVLKREYRSRSRQVKGEAMVTDFEGMDEMPTNEVMKTIRARKRAQGQNSNQSRLKNDDESLELYAQYYRNTYKSEIWTGANDKATVDIDKAPSWLTELNVKAAILALPTGKAGGVDEIRAELINPIAEQVVPMLKTMIDAMLMTGISPTEWDEANSCQIWKGIKKGLADNIEAHRPISLTCVLRKASERVLLPQLQAEIGKLDIAQGGFRANRSTLDQILA